MGVSPQSIDLLHVDDDRVLAELTSEFLKRADDRISVQIETRASDGLDKLTEREFDAVVSDYDMPGQNGIEFLESVREADADIPFILYTGKGSEEVASAAIAAGVTDYLQKATGTDHYELLANSIKNAVQAADAKTELGDTLGRVSDAIYGLDTDWRFTFVNERAEELIERRQEEVLGKSIWVEFSAAAHSDIEERYRTAMETQESVSFEAHYEPLELWVQINAYPSETGLTVYFQDITSRKEGELRLQDERNRFQAVFEESFDAMVIADDEGKFIDVNENATTLFGVTEEELLGRSIAEFAPDDFDFAEAWSEFQKSVKERGTFPLVRPDGSIRFVEYAATSDIVPGHHLSILRDVTERKEREQRYNAIFNQTYQFAGLLEPDGTLIEANETVLQFGGLERDEVIGKKMWDAYWFQHSEETRARAKNAVERAASGEFVRHELSVQGADGEEVIIDFSVRPITNELGDVTFLIPEGRDITELKEYQRELESKSRRLEAILENTTTPMFMKADNGEHLFVNRGYRELFGLEDEEIVGQTDHDIHPPEMAAAVTKNDQLVIESGETVVAEERIIVNGDERIFLTSKVPIYDIGERTDPDNPVAVFGVASDVTVLKDRERQLTRYETLVEVSGDPMYMLDDEGRFTYVNESLVEMSGHGTESLIREPVRHVMDTEDIERGEKLIRSLLTSDERRGTFEMSLVTAEGDRIPTENHISLLYEDGEFKGTVGVLRNITDRLEQEGQLQRERDRLDEFAGFVSHDLRNPLNVAEGRLDLAMQDCESEHLGSVAQALDRMEALIDDVLALARAGESVGEMETVELADHVEACWQNVGAAPATLVADTETTLQADKSRLQQLFENLLRNAVEHGGEDVTITIGDLPDGFYVEDDGPGISEEDRGSILDAGYSTAVEGTGFGLSIVRGIAEAHDWEIHITEADNGGARFEIRRVATE